MREGIEIRFLPDMTASAFHNGRRVFTGSMHNGLIYVDTTTTYHQAYTSEVPEAQQGNKQQSMNNLIHRRRRHISHKLKAQMTKTVNVIRILTIPRGPQGTTH